jgi:G3E family GTPase
MSLNREPAEIFGATHTLDIRTFTLRIPTPPASAPLIGALDRIVASLGDDLVRVKGIVRVADHAEPMLIEAVGRRISPPQSITVEGNWLVFIVIGDKAAEVRKIFDDVGIEQTAA